MYDGVLDGLQYERVMKSQTDKWQRPIWTYDGVLDGHMTEFETDVWQSVKGTNDRTPKVFMTESHYGYYGTLWESHTEVWWSLRRMYEGVPNGGMTESHMDKWQSLIRLYDGRGWTLFGILDFPVWCNFQHLISSHDFISNTKYPAESRAINCREMDFNWSYHHQHSFLEGNNLMAAMNIL